jgi:Kef-type K+ transport system membrane component KefB
MDIILPLLLILVVAKITGEIFVLIKQPPIIGEMLAGVILGPSILNQISPDIKGLDVLAEMGIFFILFYGGMQMHLADFKEYLRPSVFIALTGNNLAIIAGVAVGVIFNLDFMSVFFIIVVFSLTALPVGVRILMDMGKLNTRMGKIIIASAVIDDILCMFFLALALSYAQGDPGKMGAGSVIIMILKILLFLVLIYYLYKFMAKKGDSPIYQIKSFISKLSKESQFFVVLIFGIFIGILGQLLEISFIIGVFYAGILIKESTIGKEAFSNIYDVVSSITFSFFSPILFAYLGLLLNLSLVFNFADPFSTQNILQGKFLLIALVFAIAGKTLGAFIGGVIAGLKSREALAVGIGLNARGLMGLIISGIGLKYGLIDMRVYAMLVIMCIFTTFITPYGLKKILK